MTFETVTEEVADILEKNTDARYDDMTLYSAYVWQKIQGKGLGAGWLQNVFSDKRFRIMNGIAPYETISRLRRKVQEQREELRPTPERIEERKRIEQNYRKYAREYKCKN